MLRVLTDHGLVRRIPAAGVGGALRSARRRQPPPPGVPRVRFDQRRRLRHRAGAVPAPPVVDGFDVDEAEVIYWGRCRSCATAAASSTEPSDPSEPVVLQQREA